ncbi:MAG: hypothetical protein R2769_11625 [Saprospiraceae bacterium]
MIEEDRHLYALDILEFVASLDNPMDVNLMLDEFVQILYPRDISQEQKDYLKGVLLPVCQIMNGHWSMVII